MSQPLIIQGSEQQGCAPLPKSHLEHGSTCATPSLSRAWEGTLVFSQGLMWGSGYTAGRVLAAEKLTSLAPSLGAGPGQPWGLCGGSREATVLSPAWAALCQCHRAGPSSCSGLVGSLQPGSRVLVLRGSAAERFVFMCSYLGRSSSNGLTRYFYFSLKFSEHCQLQWLLYSVSEKTVTATEHGNWSLQPGFLFCYKQNHYSHLPFNMKTTSTFCGHLFIFF